MKKVLSAIGISGAIYLLPVVAFAQNNPGNFFSLMIFGDNITTFINSTLVPLIFALAFLLFLWGVFKYFFWGGGDETKREEGRQLMLWAIIGFLLMVSIWGIVNILSSGLGFSGANVDTLIPHAPVRRN